MGEILRARQEFEQGNRFQEVPRNQAATNFNRVAPRQQFQQQQQQQPAPQFNPQQQQPQRPNFDPRRRQPVQQPQPTEQERRHFAQAEAQINEAVRLQNCLDNPS